MKKLFMLSIIALAVSCGSCWGAGTAQAEETALSSRGTIVYRQDGAEVAFYAEDLFLLERQLSTMPGYPFDPGGYDHSAWQEAAQEQSVEEVVEKNRAARAVMEQAVLDQGDEPMEEEQTETEREDDGERLDQTGTGDASAPEDPSEDTPSEKEEEDISIPEDPSGEDLSGDGDQEDPSKENPPESESQEEPSISENSSNKNSSGNEGQEEPSASADLQAGDPTGCREDTSTPISSTEGKPTEREEKKDMPAPAGARAEKTENPPETGDIQSLTGQPEESRSESKDVEGQRMIEK